MGLYIRGEQRLKGLSGALEIMIKEIYANYTTLKVLKETPAITENEERNGASITADNILTKLILFRGYIHR